MNTTVLRRLRSMLVRVACPLVLVMCATLVALAMAVAQSPNPRVRISPGSGGYPAGAQVAVAIQYCSRYGFDMTTEQLTVNGAPVSLSGSTTVTGTQTDCAFSQFERRLTLALGLGNNLFRARIENDPDGIPGNADGTLGQASVNYDTPYPAYGVSVIADNRYVEARASQARDERYTITNTGEGSTTFGSSCTWSPLTGCTVSPSTVTLAAGASAAITATVAVGAVGSVGTLTFSVSGGTGPLPASAGASTDITAVGGPTTARGVSLTNATGISERKLCVTIAAGGDAASECGELRFAHALPSIRTKGKARTPVLIYNSGLADPVVAIPAQVALGAGFVVSDVITATVVITSPASMSSVTYAAGQWLASDWPASGEAQRITASFDGSALPTGKYGYRLEVRRGADGIVDYANGTLLHVNRSRSPMHGGWWLAGVEQLLMPEGGGLMWIGGDGSARFYAPGASCEWQAENLDRVDKIVCGGSGWYTRLLPNGLKVVFDPTGLHRYTVNRLADTTEFTYTAQQSVASINVPPRTNGIGAATYTFHYNATSALLDSVSAPPLSATVSRRVRVTWNLGRVTLAGANGGRILRLDDPDTTSIAFHYVNETSGQGDYRVTSRVNRRTITTTYGYGTGAKLASASTPASASQTVTQSFRPAEGQGIAASPAAAGRSMPLDSVYTFLDGPRTDVVDVTKWWVNRYGAPLRVHDPAGVETRIVYDAAWPGLAATVTSPSGLITAAYYNARGLVDSTKAFNPLGDARDAVVRYSWHATWDMPVQTLAPTGEPTSQDFDVNGNTLWQQIGNNPARRVTFEYDPVTKQLVAMRTPTIVNPDRIEYDPTLRNVSQTITPSGIWLRHVTDALGRDTLVQAPIDASYTQTARIIYDLADRVKETRTAAPALPYTLFGTAEASKDTAVVLPETLVVRTTYDPEGNVTRLQKQAYPDPRPWLNTCDAPRGQCSGVSSADTGSVDVRTYDWVNRLLTQRLGSRGGEFTYDPAGNVLTRQSWNSLLAMMAYDAANRPVTTITPQRTFGPELCQGHATGTISGPGILCLMRFPLYPTPGGTGLTIPGDTARFAFDQAGAMIGAYNALARVDRTYYSSGAVKTDKLALRNYTGAQFNTSYLLTQVYDLSGRRTVLRTPSDAQHAWSGDSIRYQYDPDLGVLSDVWQGASHVRLTVDLAGRQDSLLIGSGATYGVREGRTYDADGQLIRRVRTSTALGGLVTDSSGYDLRGKALDVYTSSRAVDVGTMEYHTRYSGLGAVLAHEKFKAAPTWDIEEFRTTGLGDVYRARVYHGNGVNDSFPWLMTYNQFGSLVAKQPVRDYSMPGASTFEDTTYAQVDDAGNVVRTGTVFRSMFVSGPSGQMATRSYFDAENRLRVLQRYDVATGTRSGSWEEYRYDALGRKVLSRARRDSLCVVTSTNSCASYVERTVWDGDQILYELRGEGSDASPATALNSDVSTSPYDYGKVGYVHAGGIDAPLVLMDGRVPTYNWRGLPESSVWLDGTAADCSVSPAGPCTTIAWPGTGVYMMPTPMASYPNRPTWVGSLLGNGVGSTGMAYRRNRFYDASTGQFNQQDPIGLAGGANSYGFASGDPVSYSDPFGLCPEWVDGKPCDLNAAASAAAGFGDAMTFGATNWIRDKIDANGAVDKDGAAYFGGQVTGIVTNALAGGSAVGAAVDFLVTAKGTAVAVPTGAVGPSSTRAPGMQFVGGAGGKGMDSRVTGVRVMDANKNQGRRAVYMNDGGHTVSPRTGRQVPPDDPEAHHYIPE